MKKDKWQHAVQRRIRWVGWLVAVICVPLLAACGQQAQRAPLKVVATIAPLGDWAQQVGRDRVEVTQIVPVGVNPETYTLTDADRQALAEAQVVLANGLDLEPWLADVLVQRDPQSFVGLQIADFVGPLPQGKRVMVRMPDEVAEDQPLGERERSVYVPGTVYSPYLWLSPGSTMAQRSVLLIADTLTRADPQNIRFYRGNAERYTGDLDNLDYWVKRQVTQWPTVVVGSSRLRVVRVADHSWFYFAQQYGITLRTLTSGPVLDAADEQRTAVFVNRYTSDENQRRLSALGDPDAVLDPFVSDNYIEMIKTNVEMMSQGVQQAYARTGPLGGTAKDHLPLP